jgi:hypothetical protein
MADICFPKNNEEKYVEIARKLSIESLIFVYEREPVKTEGHCNGLLVRDNVKGKADFFFSKLPAKTVRKNIIYFFEGTEEKRSFHFPMRSITQVGVKELRNSVVGISFNHILKNPAGFERLSHFVRMCNKYKVNMFVASFARHPFELRGKRELMAFSKLIGINSRNNKPISELLNESD